MIQSLSSLKQKNQIILISGKEGDSYVCNENSPMFICQIALGRVEPKSGAIETNKLHKSLACPAENREEHLQKTGKLPANDFFLY